MADAAAADTASAPEFGRLFPEYASQLGFSGEECKASGPRCEIGRVSKATGSIEQIPQFADAGAKLNIPRNCDARLRPAASGLRCWGVVRDATNRPNLPPSEDGVLAWSSLVATGRSFKIYVARLDKARTLSGVNTAWETEATLTAGRGLAVTKERLTRLPAAKGWSDEYAFMALISWTFPLRVPSDCLPVATQRAEEELTSDDRLGGEAVIGLADRKLAIRLNKRGHILPGSRMARARICED